MTPFFILTVHATQPSKFWPDFSLLETMTAGGMRDNFQEEIVPVAGARDFSLE